MAVDGAEDWDGGSEAEATRSRQMKTEREEIQGGRGVATMLCETSRMVTLVGTTSWTKSVCLSVFVSIESCSESAGKGTLSSLSLRRECLAHAGKDDVRGKSMFGRSGIGRAAEGREVEVWFRPEPADTDTSEQASRSARTGQDWWIERRIVLEDGSVW